MTLFLQIVLYILVAIFWLSGIGTSVLAKSAIHEILASLYFGFGALVLASIAITHAVNRRPENAVK